MSNSEIGGCPSIVFTAQVPMIVQIQQGINVSTIRKTSVGEALVKFPLPFSSTPQDVIVTFGEAFKSRHVITIPKGCAWEISVLITREGHLQLSPQNNQPVKIQHYVK